MKKIGILVVFLLTLLNLCGCQKTEKELLNSSYSTAPFCNAEEIDPDLSEEDVKDILSMVPSDQYETYPSMQNVPLSATLYKDGKVVSLDVGDPRVIRIVNFFNNSLYYKKMAYAQSYLSKDYLEEHVYSDSFRLELKYTPYGDEKFGPYQTSTTLCDTFIVTGQDAHYYLINHERIPYEHLTDHAVMAAGYTPFFWKGPWLELFGF